MHSALAMRKNKELKQSALFFRHHHLMGAGPDFFLSVTSNAVTLFLKYVGLICISTTFYVNFTLGWH